MGLKAPVAEMLQNCAKSARKPRVHLIRDQFDDLRPVPPGSEGLHGRAAEDPRAGGRIENTKTGTLRHQPGGHEVRDAYRGQEQAMALSVPLASLRGVPLADSIGVEGRTLAFSGFRHGPRRLRNGRASPCSLFQHAHP